MRKLHIFIGALSLASLTALAAGKGGNSVARPLVEISVKYPFLSCAREVAHFGKHIKWKLRKNAGAVLGPKAGIAIDVWEDVLEYELQYTRKRIETIAKEDPFILNRLKKIRDGLKPNQPSVPSEDILFPYAMNYEPSRFWWRELKEQGYRFQPLTLEKIGEFGSPGEFSKMLVDIDEQNIFVNTLFDFDLWLPHHSSDNVIDPDTTLVQALAAAYFQRSMATAPTYEFVRPKFIAFLKRLVIRSDTLTQIFHQYEEEDPEFHTETFVDHAFIIFQERWALEQQIAFYEHATARNWHVNSPIVSLIREFDWNHPPTAFLSSFAFYHDVNPNLVKALWSQDLPTSLLPKTGEAAQ